MSKKSLEKLFTDNGNGTVSFPATGHLTPVEQPLKPQPPEINGAGFEGILLEMHRQHRQMAAQYEADALKYKQLYDKYYKTSVATRAEADDIARVLRTHFGYKFNEATGEVTK